MSMEFKPDREKLRLNLARLKKGQDVFEIDINLEKAFEYLEGRGTELREVLLAQTIFEDVHKALPVPEKRLIAVFGTKDPLQIADIILRQGEIQLTGEFRKKQQDLRRKQIVDIIHRNGVDPGTKYPHPHERIERAMDEAKVNVDFRKSAQEQVRDILKQLMPILPMKFETKEIEIRIPQRYASQAYPRLRMYGKMVRSEWSGDGSWYGVIDLPGGMETEFFDMLNRSTHGNNSTRILKES